MVAALATAALLAGLLSSSATAQKPERPSTQGGAAGTAASKQTELPRLAAKAWILIDPRDGSVLAGKAPEKPMPIASATKLMTAYLALENLKPGEIVRSPAYQPSFSAEITLGLSRGERVRVRDLLYGLLLPSANDAAEAIAVGVSDSVPTFVTEMNQAAQELGLANTSYANPIGLDDPDNYSSAHDLVRLAALLLGNRLFARIADSTSATIRSDGESRQVSTRNTLLEEVPWIDGVKTGHTLGAGYVLVGSGTQNGTQLISAVLGATSEASRDAETLELLEYGFSLYRKVQPVDRGEELATPELDYRDEALPLLAKRAIRVEIREGQRVATRVDAPDEVSGEVEDGQKVGLVTVTVDGKRAASTSLVAAHAVSAATVFDKGLSSAQNPILLIGLGGSVILVGVLLTTRGRARRGAPATIARPPQPERQSHRQRTPEERRRMHEERMRRRRERTKREGGSR